MKKPKGAAKKDLDEEQQQTCSLGNCVAVNRAIGTKARCVNFVFH